MNNPSTSQPKENNNERAQLRSPPPLIRVNNLYSSLPMPQAIRPGREAPHRKELELEENARNALYHYVFHLEKEKKEVEDRKENKALTSFEFKQLEDLWNLLDKKIFTIHELLELMN